MHVIYLSFLIVFIRSAFGGVSSSWTYTYDPSSTAWNPLKGLVPYYYYTSSQPQVNFPHSMENHYFPMKDLMTGPDSFDFSSIDSVLRNVASRSHHAIVRVYVDWPGQDLSLSVPDFLWNGLTLYSGSSDQGLFPDYNNQTLINAMVILIQALGRAYDGDIRIGFWQVGFLGHWGEWHTSPNTTYFASTSHQDQIIAAFTSSFTKTIIQLRYFAVTGSYNPTSLNVGFHDDSFDQDTYGLSWMFYNTSVAVGATNQWRSRPIGGEVRPELMPCAFASDPVTACQLITDLTPLDWATCVQLTHSTYQWLSYAFYTPGYSSSDYSRAVNGSIMQGYSFYVSEITATEMTCSGYSHVIRIDVTMSNAGVAPFYYPLILNLDQVSFVYSFDIAAQTYGMIQFFIWLSSPNLVGSQAIVFAISGASTSGIIQLPAVSIEACATQSFSTGCTSYITSAQANGTQSTSYTVTSSSNVHLLLSPTNVKRVVEWNTLKVKWGPDPLVTNDDAFVRQPRTVQQALQEQYKRLPNGLGDQCIGKTTVGYHYWKNNDTAVILLFDRQGTIAGIQMAFPRLLAKDKFYSYDTQKLFNRETINNVDMYTITAYFIEPAKICTVGRTLSRLEHEGTGTGLFFQNGTNPLQDSIEVPFWENDIGRTKWTRGACFKTMGNHYWYDNHLNKNCSEFLPGFALYNKGQLSAFGWIIVDKFDFSPRIEFPPKTAILSFLNPVPKCMSQQYDDAGGFSTMHTYFNTDPANLEC
ncbi:unnamed protein product [Adineta steineri]|uniref:DUF4832 domain-containing protein n=1 Tax=Adineta steineri TaxID=433720 RepID=A0A814UGH7_9BILA|nr:unnamed protein product [Adineta steineri]CAF1175034.1 unnamed protein product [Adineta steineri]